jgi:hypothetical protein
MKPPLVRLPKSHEDNSMLLGSATDRSTVSRHLFDVIFGTKTQRLAAQEQQQKNELDITSHFRHGLEPEFLGQTL